MKYDFFEVSDLRFANAEGTAIICMVLFLNNPYHSEPVPFTAVQYDPSCEHSEEIFVWATSGYFGEIAPYAEPEPTVPESVTPAQAKIALFEWNVGKDEAGNDRPSLLDTVEALVADYPYRPVSIWWANASQFERGNPYIQALGVELGLADEQIDALFIAAGKK